VTPSHGTKIAGVMSPYVQDGLTNGTTYYDVVAAVTSNGESAPSSQVSATLSGSASANTCTLGGALIGSGACTVVAGAS